MRILLHQWLCPHSRKVRLGLAEKKLNFQLQVERPWEKREVFLAMSPTASLPVFIEDSSPIIHHQAIAEFLEEIYPDPPLMCQSTLQRAEIRRLSGWIDDSLYHDVWMKTVFEKVYKRYNGLGHTNGQVLREGVRNLHEHLHLFEKLLKQKHWLAGNNMTWADMSAGGMFSSLDYLGDIPWSKYPEVKNWYARLKSRPCFRSILADQIPGIPPSPQYANLDF